MNYNKKTVMDVDVAGKKILLRCDFNVPQDKKTGAITSDKRIVAALPTIRYLLEQGAAVIACSHLGKPNATFDAYVKKQVEKGKKAEDLTEADWIKSNKKLSLAPVAARLAELLEMPAEDAGSVGEHTAGLSGLLRNGPFRAGCDAQSKTHAAVGVWKQIHHAGSEQLSQPGESGSEGRLQRGQGRRNRLFLCR